MKILVYGQRVKSEHLDVIKFTFDTLLELGFQLTVFEPYYQKLPDYLKSHDFKIASKDQGIDEDQDVLLSLGGDGTILSAITYINSKNIPILGINLGRLGFLAIVDKQNIKAALVKLKNQEFAVEERTMLSLNAKGLFEDYPYALNDLTLHKRDTSSMIKVNAWINDKFLKSYWADGIILSTPTGSTGYSLSCGGPIIFPNAQNFVLTAVAPHNLSSRPLVIPDDSRIRFTVEGRTNNFLCTLDSRYQTIGPEIELHIRKADFKTKLIKLEGADFLKTMQDKMMWGLDNRN